uniref:Osmotic avoidance abnormal protein 3 (inferred by orthology to a C. elegans protein) n=1 Tax=Anisakis simplex TaxID=6269 RepID=A0A0M3JPC5_ANISI
LTRLLKDCLVGNARTTMLATVSPSAEFSNETLSTLRFATQAASVALKPKVNIDPFLELVNSKSIFSNSLSVICKMMV